MMPMPMPLPLIDTPEAARAYIESAPPLDGPVAGRVLDEARRMAGLLLYLPVGTRVRISDLGVTGTIESVPGDGLRRVRMDWLGLAQDAALYRLKPLDLIEKIGELGIELG